MDLAKKEAKEKHKIVKSSDKDITTGFEELQLVDLAKAYSLDPWSADIDG